ncbi:MAG TPA: outer membrane beta-barrel protein [Polyangia bacterium]|nr:outer membrane beta-barrel protein [Polyangia bacterium]
MLLGADLALALPVGNLGDGAGFGLGILPRFEFTLAPRLALTGRIGYIYHLEKNNIKFSEIPVLVGAKYDLTDALYGAIELGLFHMTVTGEAFGISASESRDKFGATIGAGYRAGDLDFKLGLHILDLGNAGDYMELVGNVGYNFWRG